MIEGLISGMLYGKPERRTGRNNSDYVAAKVVVPSADERIFAHVIAFVDEAKAALLALDDGDAVAIAGVMTPKVYETKNGQTKPALDVIAHTVLSPYQLADKRRGASAREQDDMPPGEI
jgi:hypothetical protein